jgi:FMNH2-dependent dimethyl sulfone monooxygenase
MSSPTFAIRGPGGEPIRFAYWVPNVSGGLVISNIEQRTSWDIDYNRKLAQTAENNGFDYALSQIRFTAGYGAEYQHEPVLFSHALLAATKRLKLIVAILPGPWNPAVAAKQLATMDQLTGGRVAVNIVSGWFRGEFHPEIFQGGSSRAARDMAARVSDWYFTNGNTPDGHAAQITDIKSKAAQNRHSVKIGVNAFIIARETEQEAKEVLDEIIEKANPEAVRAFGHEVKNAGKASPEGEGNWAKSTFEDLVQYNDGFKTNLIGTPEQIAERIVRLKTIGVDLVLTAFLHFQEEVEYFGKRVLPIVRELEQQRALAAA